MTIGFIGLGLMGRPMAQNLHAAGATLAIPRRAAASMADLGPDRIEISRDARGDRPRPRTS